MNAPCERCGLRPHSWFCDGGYICSVCEDELWAFRVFLVANFAPAKLPTLH